MGSNGVIEEDCCIEEWQKQQELLTDLQMSALRKWKSSYFEAQEKLSLMTAEAGKLQAHVLQQAKWLEQSMTEQEKMKKTHDQSMRNCQEKATETLKLQLKQHQHQMARLRATLEDTTCVKDREIDELQRKLRESLAFHQDQFERLTRKHDAMLGEVRDQLRSEREKYAKEKDQILQSHLVDIKNMQRHYESRWEERKVEGERYKQHMSLRKNEMERHLAQSSKENRSLGRQLNELRQALDHSHQQLAHLKRDYRIEVEGMNSQLNERHLACQRFLAENNRQQEELQGLQKRLQESCHMNETMTEEMNELRRYKENHQTPKTSISTMTDIDTLLEPTPQQNHAEEMMQKIQEWMQSKFAHIDEKVLDMERRIFTSAAHMDQKINNVLLHQTNHDSETSGSTMPSESVPDMEEEIESAVSIIGDENGHGELETLMQDISNIVGPTKGQYHASPSFPASENTDSPVPPSDTRVHSIVSALRQENAELMGLISKMRHDMEAAAEHAATTKRSFNQSPQQNPPTPASVPNASRDGPQDDDWRRDISTIFENYQHKTRQEMADSHAKLKSAFESREQRLTQQLNIFHQDTALLLKDRQRLTSRCNQLLALLRASWTQLDELTGTVKRLRDGKENDESMPLKHPPLVIQGKRGDMDVSKRTSVRNSGRMTKTQKSLQEQHKKHLLQRINEQRPVNYNTLRTT